ncbi:tetraprenyl-beta-curcumene synthase family protein [Paenibacillus yanchengensis]|uniref:Tetraprenyl-beta-curcumene synthase family protein n=1 Tax=Paenibacillus yanchengensis TaxID=2035833 RepID=A0ABW4YPA5_9BACL
MHRVYKYILPQVNEQLQRITERAKQIPDRELRKQALDSISTKKFHCQGGSVYAAAHPAYMPVLVPLIVALQTISDYLDNLCDRSTSMDADDFALLHQAMYTAVTPGMELDNYYAKRTEQNDAGYLKFLVITCQQQLSNLPAYSYVQSEVQQLVKLYSELQVYKHIAPHLREERLLDWWELHRTNYPQLQWHEFAAAAGSTLAMFVLFLAATDEQLTKEQVALYKQAYFPYICSLHILLDYCIDMEEDMLGGDLNFCSYYPSSIELVDRLEFILRQARKSAERLPAAKFHRLIIDGLLALYLSDPKVHEQSNVRQISRQLMKNSTLSRLFFFINSKWIRWRRL